MRINDESDTTNDADAAEIQDLIQDDENEKSNSGPSKKVQFITFCNIKSQRTRQYAMN